MAIVAKSKKEEGLQTLKAKAALLDELLEIIEDRYLGVLNWQLSDWFQKRRECSYFYARFASKRHL